MQVLTVCRFEADWAVRDVTGETYGRSPDIRNAYDAAQQMARRIGAHIEFSAEAETHYRAVEDGELVDARALVAIPAQESALGFLKRLFERRRANR